MHVVIGNGIVFAAYRKSDRAFRHARCLTGTNVITFDLNTIAEHMRPLVEAAMLVELPPEIQADENTEWEHDDDITPAVVVDVEDLDDQ